MSVLEAAVAIAVVVLLTALTVYRLADVIALYYEETFGIEIEKEDHDNKD